MTVTGRPTQRAADRFAPARTVADAVLYEGYLMYPYRASARRPVALAVRRIVPAPRAALGRVQAFRRCARVCRRPGGAGAPRPPALSPVQRRTIEAVSRRRLRDRSTSWTSTACRGSRGTRPAARCRRRRHRPAPVGRQPTEVPIHLPVRSDVEELRTPRRRSSEAYGPRGGGRGVRIDARWADGPGPT
jgi:hypothetical protein